MTDLWSWRLDRSQAGVSTETWSWSEAMLPSLAFPAWTVGATLSSAGQENTAFTGLLTRRWEERAHSSPIKRLGALWEELCSKDFVRLQTAERVSQAERTE